MMLSGSAFGLNRFANRLEEQGDSDGLKAILLETIAPLGFTDFAYHIIQTADVDNSSAKQTAGISSYPDAWTQHYIASGYVNDDPVVGKVYEKRVPFVWSDTIQIDELSKKQRQLLDDASSMGISDGLTIPLMSRMGETASLSLIPNKASLEPLHSTETVNQVHLLAEYFHTAAAKIVVEESLTAGSRRRRTLLSPRECEALTWVARGKSTWEIAKILDLSEKSVEFYLDSVKRKLQASNRTQAVVKAIMLGLISLKP